MLSREGLLSLPEVATFTQTTNGGCWIDTAENLCLLHVGAKKVTLQRNGATEEFSCEHLAGVFFNLWDLTDWYALHILFKEGREIWVAKTKNSILARQWEEAALGVLDVRQ